MTAAHRLIKRIAYSKEFCHLVSYVIIGFAIVVGMETFQLPDPWTRVISVLEYLFLTFFSIEILLRILAEDHPLDFFNLFKTKRISIRGRKKTELEITEHGFWNYFDFILITLSIIALFINMLVFPGLLQVGRLFRIFRIARLLEISDHLREVEKRIASIIPTVFSFAALLLILTYIYSIVGMFMFEKKAFALSNFSSIHDSFITLFQVMTLDGWSEMMKDLTTNVHSFPPIVIEIYFISFVILTAIVAFNVFIAVMTSHVQEKLERNNETDSQNIKTDATMQEMISEIRGLKTEVAELRAKIPI